VKHLLVIIALISATHAAAQGVHVQGVGTLSCGKYLQLRAEKNSSQDGVFVSWIWGYIAGFNMEVRQPTTRDLPDEASTLAYVDKHCRENPLDNVIIAVNALIRDLGGRRNPR
jgi:hypothetical protein